MVATIQAELRLVNGAGGVPGTGAGGGSDGDVKKSLSDIARFFRRPQQILGGGGMGGIGQLAGMGGTAAAISLGLLGAIAAEFSLEKIFQSEKGQELKTNIDMIGQMLPDWLSSAVNAGVETTDALGIGGPITSFLKKLFQDFGEIPEIDQASKDKIQEYIDLLNKIGEATTVSEALPAVDEGAENDPEETPVIGVDARRTKRLRLIREEAEEINKDGLITDEERLQLSNLEVAAAELLSQAQEEILDKHERGYKADQADVRLKEEAFSTLQLIDNIRLSINDQADSELSKQNQINSALRETLSLQKKIAAAKKSRAKEEIEEKFLEPGRRAIENLRRMSKFTPGMPNIPNFNF